MKLLILNGKIWKYQSTAAWYFLSSKKEQQEEIRSHQKVRKGWGAIPVTVTIGESTWKTSLFPSKDGTYLLPIKASVRKAQGIGEGDRIEARCVFS